MRFCILAGLLCLTFIAPLRSQVEVKVESEQKHYLVGEPLRVGVKIVNRSGQTLTFGRSSEWLSIGINSHQDLPVARVREVDASGIFKVPSSKAVTRWLDLSSSYRIPRPGRYYVRAVVQIKQWGAKISSPPMTLNVIEGAPLWKKTFGVPTEKSDQQVKRRPEARKYILKQMTLIDEIRLYLQITTPSEEGVYTAIPVCEMVSFSEPEAVLDPNNRIHVLCQDGARTFNYSVFKPSGELVLRRTHRYTRTRPVLRKNEQGKVVVFGGERVKAKDDYPPSKTSENKGNTDDGEQKGAAVDDGGKEGAGDEGKKNRGR